MPAVILILHCYQVRPDSSVLCWWVYKTRNSTVRRLSNSLLYFVFGWALSWGNAFAVCIVHRSLVHHFEASGKVRRYWFKFWFEEFYFALLPCSASFLCAPLMSQQKTKQNCPQIESTICHSFSLSCFEEINKFQMFYLSKIQQG